MQFKSIAVSALAQTVALTAGHNRPGVFRKKERLLFQRVSNPSAEVFVPAPQNEPTHHELAARRNTIGSVNKASESASSTQHPNELSRDECNPRSKAIDLGIFSCGANRQCVENKGSSLGGFCTNYKKIEAALHRSLEDEVTLQCAGDNEGQDSVETSYGFSCDCTNFANGTGTYTCVSEGCLEPPADYVCYTTQRDVEVGVNSYTYQYCISLDADTTTSFPVESLCYGGTVADGVPTACSVEANDAACSSCMLTECDGEVGVFRPFVDCSNTVLNTTVDSCMSREFFFALLEGLLPTAETSAPANSDGPSERPSIAPGEAPAPSAASTVKAKVVVAASFAAATWLASTAF